VSTVERLWSNSWVIVWNLLFRCYVICCRTTISPCSPFAIRWPLCDHSEYDSLFFFEGPYTLSTFSYLPWLTILASVHFSHILLIFVMTGTKLRVRIVVFWVITPCRRVPMYQRFAETYRAFLPWRWIQHIPQKNWYPPTRRESVITQKATILTSRTWQLQIL
jgi:hypothetical protein